MLKGGPGSSQHVIVSLDQEIAVINQKLRE
jgi:hypothetical protein